MSFLLLSEGIIPAIQAEQAALHGGRAGLRELSMLKMLLARVEVLSQSSATDLASLAAFYGYGLAHDQLFHSDNLPTALIVIELVLQLNGYRLVADDTTCFLGLQVVCDGELSAEAFASWIRSHIAPAEVA
ncbi:MAG TPA: death-on-curing protein [Asticcacaulis sp.]|nr:death-on-curing protein [Asticcacaulis sp.]